MKVAPYLNYKRGGFVVWTQYF